MDEIITKTEWVYSTMYNQETEDILGATKSLERLLHKQIGSIIQDIDYKIVGFEDSSPINIITEDIFGCKQDPPKVGEVICLNVNEDQFSGIDNEYRFFLRVCRCDGNYIRYFSSLKEVEQVLSGVVLELDKEGAWKRVEQLSAQSAKIKADYQLQNWCDECDEYIRLDVIDRSCDFGSYFAMD
jgi:hypothetical protein